MSDYDGGWVTVGSAKHKPARKTVAKPEAQTTKRGATAFSEAAEWIEAKELRRQQALAKAQEADAEGLETQAQPEAATAQKTSKSKSKSKPRKQKTQAKIVKVQAKDLEGISVDMLSAAVAGAKELCPNDSQRAEWAKEMNEVLVFTLKDLQADYTSFPSIAENCSLDVLDFIRHQYLNLPTTVLCAMFSHAVCSMADAAVKSKGVGSVGYQLIVEVLIGVEANVRKTGIVVPGFQTGVEAACSSVFDGNVLETVEWTMGRLVALNPPSCMHVWGSFLVPLLANGKKVSNSFRQLVVDVVSALFTDPQKSKKLVVAISQSHHKVQFFTTQAFMKIGQFAFKTNEGVNLTQVQKEELQRVYPFVRHLAFNNAQAAASHFSYHLQLPPLIKEEDAQWQYETFLFLVACIQAQPTQILPLLPKALKKDGVCVLMLLRRLPSLRTLDAILRHGVSGPLFRTTVGQLLEYSQEQLEVARKDKVVRLYTDLVEICQTLLQRGQAVPVVSMGQSASSCCGFICMMLVLVLGIASFVSLLFLAIFVFCADQQPFEGWCKIASDWRVLEWTNWGVLQIATVLDTVQEDVLPLIKQQWDDLTSRWAQSVAV
eukprot:m.26834 g.26834  ORF g.26834 m.26834 type:complete len:601 (-) comp8879_c0_seq2:182-1984(-)